MRNVGLLQIGDVLRREREVCRSRRSFQVVRLGRSHHRARDLSEQPRQRNGSHGRVVFLRYLCHATNDHVVLLGRGVVLSLSKRVHLQALARLTRQAREPASGKSAVRNGGNAVLGTELQKLALILTEDGQAGKILDNVKYRETTWIDCASLVVSNGAVCTVSLSTAPTLGAVTIAGTATFASTFSATSLALPSGGSLTVTGVGANVGAVSDYAGDFVIAGVSEWPRNTPIVSSSTDAFLAKVAASLNASETISSGLEFTVKDGSVQLVQAGIVNGSLTWTGAAGDTLWSTAGNWGDANSAIA